MERVYRRRVLLLLVSALLLSGPVLIPRVVGWVGRMIVGFHQRSVTMSLADWATEFGKIETLPQAERAIDMLGYIEWYYVPGEGYRSHLRIEAALEAQRKETIEAIVKALQAYSGQDFGNDREAWENWLKTGGGINKGGNGE